MHDFTDKIATFFLGLGIFYVGLLCRLGYYHGGKKIFRTISIDGIFFPKVPEQLRNEADKKSFWICVVLSILTIINGLLLSWVENISMVFLVLAFPGTFVFRVVFFIKKSESID